MKSVLLIDPHLSRAYASKLRGFLERVTFSSRVLITSRSSSSKEKAASWAVSNNISPSKIEIVSQGMDLTDSILLLECRTKLPVIVKKLLIKFNVKTIVSANHFFCANMETVNFIKSQKQNAIIILENVSSQKNIEEAWRLDQGWSFEVLPPVIDSLSDQKRFDSMYSSRFADMVPPGVLHAGVIMYHRPRKDRWPDSWWQEKFKTLDYYPWRSYVHFNAEKLGVTSLSVVVEDNSKRNNFFNQIYRRIEINLGIQRRRYTKYYDIDLTPYFQKFQFFICPQDIFSVFPQFGFHAMRAGLIIIGDESGVYRSLGFVDGKNYVSVGSEWSEIGIQNAIQRVKNFNVQGILKMREESIALLEGLVNQSELKLNNLLQ